jgi:hypothetical protein
VVFITDEGMSLRIPAGGLRITLDEAGQPVILPVEVEIAFDIWPAWLSIAIEHENGAVAAHAELLEAPAQAKDEQAAALRHEARAGMVSIAASAFALDAFATSVAQHLPRQLSKPAKRNQVSRITETLHRAFKMSNVEAKALRRIISQALLYRAWVVHPPADFRRPYRHPDLHTGVEWRFIEFSAANATALRTNALNTVDWLLSNPRAGNAVLHEWCASAIQRVGALKSEADARTQSAT